MWRTLALVLSSLLQAFLFQACFFLTRGDGTGKTNPPAPEAHGDLGLARFQFVCSDREESTCAESREFPSRLARGATFELHTSESAQLQAASERLVITGRGSARTEAAGVAGVYAQSLATSAVLDFLHFQVAEVAALALEEDDGVVRLRLLDADGAPLAGTIVAAWSVADPTIAAIDPGAMHADVTRLRAGATELTATYGALSATLVLKELP